jgi:TonB-linked SusC/RagA family outer membrane protein
MKLLRLLLGCLFLVSPMLLLAQKGRLVTGTISSTQNASLENVTIIEKGTNNSAVTDASGKFSITLTRDNSVLIFSFVGFRSKEVAVGSATDLKVSLESDGSELEGVVITALGISRKERSLGYSTQAVKGNDLTLTKEQNVLGSLAGKIAGVQVTGASGASMGGTQKIKIRGVNSINGSGEPLIVIDGTPVSNANFAGRNGGDFGNLAQDINPEDIESVNVLKGPAASALYGIRGQYGVIMITTKKGNRHIQKPVVQLNSAFSVERVGNFLPLQDVYGGGSSQTWRTLANGDKYVDMAVDESWGPKMDGTLARSVFSFYPQDPEFGQLTPFVPYPDNVKDFFETGVTVNNGITVSGGGMGHNYRISFNDTRIRGVEPNTWLRRNNLGLSFGVDLTKKLVLSSNLNFAYNKGQRPSQGYDGGSRYLVQWFQRNIDMNKLKDYKYPDGTFKNWNLSRPSSAGVMSSFKALYWNNPYFEAYENINNDNRSRFFGDIGLTYIIKQGFKVSAFARGDMFTQNIEDREAFGGRYVPGYSTGKYENREMNYELMAEYNKSWNNVSLDVNAGSNLYSRRYSYLVMGTKGGLSSPGFYNIAASVDRPSVTSYLLRKEIRSLYAMASVGYKNTYFLDASLRNDNSSTLPKNSNSYWYPSLSASFVFSELVEWKPLTYGKVRLSYAKAGSDLNPYQTTPTFGVGGIYGTTNTLFVPDNLANPDIKPSFANSYEAGIDLKFFKNRLGIDFTYYTQKNKNQILNLDVSGTSGVSSTVINAGLIENKGVELSITGIPLQAKNFSWEVAFNIARNKSMVKELYPGTNVYALDVNTYSGVSVYLNSYVGKPFGSLIGKAYQRDSATGKILLSNTNMPLYTEANHDFGSVLPDYTGGLRNSIRFRNFDLGVMIDYQFGGQFFSWSKMLAVKTGMAAETAALNDKGKNVRDALIDGGGVRVNGIVASTKQEVTAYVDARTYFRTTLGTHVYEEWLYDASYIKLREVRLGYTFGKRIMSKLPFSNMNIAFIARYPAMIWQKAPEGVDPSELSSGGNSISWLETGALNTVRSYGINLNINF